MAWTIYNKGLFLIANSAITASTDFRGLIVAGASVPAGLTNAAALDLNTVADVLAVSGTTEAAASGYARADLASVAITEDDTNDRVDISWANFTWTTVAAGETWRAFVLYIEGASDAARNVFGIDVFTAVPTNGSNVAYSGAGIRVQR
jgi:hypothetical protein